MEGIFSVSTSSATAIRGFRASTLFIPWIKSSQVQAWDRVDRTYEAQSPSKEVLGYRGSRQRVGRPSLPHLPDCVPCLLRNTTGIAKSRLLHSEHAPERGVGGVCVEAGNRSLDAMKLGHAKRQLPIDMLSRTASPLAGDGISVLVDKSALEGILCSPPAHAMPSAMVSRRRNLAYRVQTG